MKKSEIVRALADLASKVKIEVTPLNVVTLAKNTNTLFTEAAQLINALEAEENEEKTDDC